LCILVDAYGEAHSAHENADRLTMPSLMEQSWDTFSYYISEFVLILKYKSKLVIAPFSPKASKSNNSGFGGDDEAADVMTELRSPKNSNTDRSDLSASNTQKSFIHEKQSLPPDFGVKLLRQTNSDGNSDNGSIAVSPLSGGGTMDDAFDSIFNKKDVLSLTTPTNHAAAAASSSSSYQSSLDNHGLKAVSFGGRVAKISAPSASAKYTDMVVVQSTDDSARIISLDSDRPTNPTAF
jgi:hypothetical protein